MRIIGLIAEYNPFHNGHLYQINKIKEMYPDSMIILVLSSTFTQRGEVSIINKFNKTKIALNNNIDLVVELPFVYATQSSDIFARGAVTILNNLKINTLVFGSETNDINTFKTLADIQLNNKEYDILVKKYLDTGLNYPTSLSKALKDLTDIKIDKPNDLLALSYVKEIIKQNLNIDIVSIKRTNDYHNSNLDNNIISASTIRNLLNNNNNNNNVDEYIPYDINEYISNIDMNKYFNLLKYQIINNINNLNKFQTVDEGIENRIIKYINKANNLDELINLIKTKRYTYNKINRMFTHILCNFTKEEAKNINIDYIRILGFNNIGKQYLNKIKKEINIPLIVKNITNTYKCLDIEQRISYIYSLLLNSSEQKRFITREFSNKPVIK